MNMYKLALTVNELREMGYTWSEVTEEMGLTRNETVRLARWMKANLCFWYEK